MRISDWSSDVCSSDLDDGLDLAHALAGVQRHRFEIAAPRTQRRIGTEQVDRPSFLVADHARGAERIAFRTASDAIGAPATLCITRPFDLKTLNSPMVYRYSHKH